MAYHQIIRYILIIFFFSDKHKPNEWSMNCVHVAHFVYEFFDDKIRHQFEVRLIFDVVIDFVN